LQDEITGRRYLPSVAKSRYLGTTATNQDYTDKENKGQTKSTNPCYQVLVRIPKGKGTLDRRNHRREGNNKTIFKKEIG
jgi:hypothetical protein